RRAAEIVADGRQTAAERVERQETGLVDDRRRHVLELEAHDELSQTPRGGQRRHDARSRTSRSTSRIAVWIRPLLATSEGESRSGAPPVRLLPRPPPPSTSRLPAATPHGPRRGSQ